MSKRHFQKSLKQIEIHDVGMNNPKHVCPRKLTNRQDPTETTQLQPSAVKKVESLQENNQRSEQSSESVVKDLPPVPKSSVQFHLSWSSIKADKALRFRFLKVNVHTSITQCNFSLF